MQPLCHPEVLSPAWIPFEPIGRVEEQALLRRWLEEDSTFRGGGPILIEGPPGCGSSTLARWAARERAGRDRGGTAERGRVLAVRVRGCVGASGVAAGLLREYDEGFRERGFSVAEIMAGVLRRANRERRAITVVLDDAGPGSPDLTRLLGALDRPERFLPEGEELGFPLRTIVVGASPATAAQMETRARTGLRRLRLAALDRELLGRILKDRAERALAGPFPDGAVRQIVERVELEGHGAVRGMELLRELLRGPEPTSPPPAGGRSGSFRSLEPLLVEAVARACTSGPARVSEVRSCEDRLARTRGERPLPATTFWRRILRLEQMGLISREVRAGGPGGSRSTIRLLAGPDRMARLTADRGTPPGWGGSGAPGRVPGEGAIRRSSPAGDPRNGECR